MVLIGGDAGSRATECEYQRGGGKLRVGERVCFSGEG